MNLLFERHIQRKLELIDSLYFSHTTPCVSDLAKILNVSESTVKNDLRQFELLSEDGTVLRIKDKDRRMNLHDTIMMDSLLTKTMRFLLLYPGKRAEYYSDQLMISRVNFYKHINYWNVRLQQYQASIVVKDGYQIIAEDERLFRFFIFYFLLFTNTENSVFITSNVDVFTRILKANNLSIRNLKRGDIWEESFIASLLGIYIVRQLNRKTSIAISQEQLLTSNIEISLADFEKIRELLPNATYRTVVESLTEFKQTLTNAPKQVNIQDVKVILQRFENELGYSLGVKDVDMEVIASTLSLGATLHTLFPFDVRGCSITMKDFIKEYTLINPELVALFKQFLDIATEYLDVNYHRYQDMLFYWTIVNLGDFMFTPRKRILFVSRYHENHLTFCHNELISLLKILKIEPIVKVVNANGFDENEVFDLIISDCDLNTDQKVIYLSFSNGILSADVIRSIHARSY